MSDTVSFIRNFNLLQMATFYDLEDSNERLRSSYDLMALFFDVSDIIKAPLFVEAGAFAADASREYRKRNADARIVAFEANPFSFKHWTEKIKYEKVGVEYLNLALSDSSEPVTFNIPNKLDGKNTSLVTGRSSILERTDEKWEYEKLEIPAVTLDGFFKHNYQKNIIWMDVEGAAQQVLKGGFNFLRNTKMILIEVEEIAFWKDQWLVEDVIRYFDKVGLRLIARDFESPSRRQYNLLFCSQDIEEQHFFKIRLLNYYNRAAFKKTLKVF